MNYLILYNAAPKYHIFFNRLAKNLTSSGSIVYAATDCHLSRKENLLSNFFDEDRINVFYDFFVSSEVDELILDKYKDFNLNYALLSDYERGYAYGIWGRKNNRTQTFTAQLLKNRRILGKIARATSVNL